MRACRPLARPFSCSGTGAAASCSTQPRRSRQPAPRAQRRRGTHGAARASGGAPPGAGPDPDPARGPGPPSLGGPQEGGLVGSGDPQAGQLGRRLGLALFGAATVALVTLTLSSGLSPAALVARLEALVDASGPAGPAVYIGAYAVSTTLFFPAALLTLGAGCRPPSQLLDALAHAGQCVSSGQWRHAAMATHGVPVRDQCSHQAAEALSETLNPNLFCNQTWRQERNNACGAECRCL